jgi:hypothetical protein
VKLIVNADDLGVTAGVNHGILLGFSRGILSSASLMVNQDGTDAAIEYLRSGLIPRAGVHLCISAGRPVVDPGSVRSLVDEEGFFHRPSYLMHNPPELGDVIREFEAQIDKVLQRGVSVTHLDTHHHIHRLPVVLEALIHVAHRYKLPVRHLEPQMRDYVRAQGVATPDWFCGEWIGPAVSLHALFQAVKGAKQAGHRIVELMTHPGLADAALAGKSAYVTERQRELALLCAPETRDWLKANGIELCDYACVLEARSPAPCI